MLLHVYQDRKDVLRFMLAVARHLNFIPLSKRGDMYNKALSALREMSLGFNSDDTLDEMIQKIEDTLGLY